MSEGETKNTSSFDRVPGRGSPFRGSRGATPISAGRAGFEDRGYMFSGKGGGGLSLINYSLKAKLMVGEG